MIKKGGIYTTEFSEFTFGYALTRDIERSFSRSIAAVPYFPSLSEEGKDGIGYDVKIELPIFAILLQFKIPRCVKRFSIKTHSDEQSNITPPSYRFYLHKRDDSTQHKSLVDSDDGTKIVAYAAPVFHSKADLNSHFRADVVLDRCAFAKPSDIGYLPDNDEHHVAYDDGVAMVFCSDPHVSKVFKRFQFREVVERRLTEEPRSRDQFFENLLRSMLQSAGVSDVSDELRALELEGRPELACSYVAQAYLDCQLLIARKRVD